MPPFNANINEALLILEHIISDMETGFVACERCGDQQATKDLDFFDDVKKVRELVLKSIGNGTC